MSKRKRILMWTGLVLSFLASGYTGVCVIFYSWLNAAKPENYPKEQAEVWVYSALALAILFFGLFFYCLVSLIRDVNKRYREEQNET